MELHHFRSVIDDYNNPEDAELIFGKEKPEDLLALCREDHLPKHISPLGDFVVNRKRIKANGTIVTTSWNRIKA